jgi:hypothetical protein
VKRDAVNKLEKKLTREVIRRSIRDLGGVDASHCATARIYILGDMFLKDCEISGYPPELVDTLKEMVVLSGAERRYLSREILEILDREWKP